MFSPNDASAAGVVASRGETSALGYQAIFNHTLVFWPGTRTAIPQLARWRAAQNSYASMIIGSFFAAAIHSCIAGIAVIVSQYASASRSRSIL